MEVNPDESKLNSMEESPTKSRLSKHFSASRNVDERVEIEWEHISYNLLEKDPARSKFMKTAYKEKKILQNLCGSAQSGRLLAIMGPTGCGKTSFLNILAARCPEGSKAFSKLEGNIAVNGATRNDSYFRSISAYVLQDDNLYPHLTVLETFTLAAAFYLPFDANQSEIVDDIIRELGLTKARDTIIGDDKLRGVSGGERKRANIGTQLISDPAVLFLDEPTSGLDSFQALSVMEAMKDMTAHGRLVVTVIHQPRSSIFTMFDDLLLLSEGRTMYFGPSAGAILHFEKQGQHCPKLFNPADFFLDILSPDVRSSTAEEESFQRIKLLGDSWALIQNESQTGVVVAKKSVDNNLIAVKGIGQEGFYWKKELHVISLLFWRTWAEQSRDIATLGIKFVISIFFALIIGGLFSNIGYDQKSIQNRNGLMYFLMINQGFNTLISVVNTFPKEKNIVNRERSNHAYTTLAYFASKVLVEIPLIVLPSLIYSLILYWMVKLNNKHFIEFALILMLLNVTVAALGLAVSAISPNVEAANAMATPFMIIGILFGGFYINIDSLPIVANWLPYLSYFRWGFQALTINEFSGLTFKCDANSPGAACLKTGDEVLASLSFANHTIYYACFGLGMVLLGFLVWGYLNLVTMRLKFLSLGFTGPKYAKFVDAIREDAIQKGSSSAAEREAGGSGRLDGGGSVVPVEDNADKI